MTVSKPKLPPKVFLHLPASVRLRLALFALWRRRQASMLKTSMLTLCLAVLSGMLGYLIAQPPPQFPTSSAPELSAATPDERLISRSQTADPTASQWGALQAEVLRLRLLYRQIAAITELENEDFALSVTLADERYSESLSTHEDSVQAAQQRFTLAKRAVDHMTDQAQLILSISQLRDQERRFTLSGSPVVRARITSLFGYRTDPRSGRKQFHRGLDFGGKPGSRVLALADGVVTYSGENGGYGNLVELEHADGYRTRYAHNEKNLVPVGASVSKGQVIAAMGSTGKSTGTHVHVEVRLDGRAVDPLQFVGPSLAGAVVAEGAAGAARAGS